LIDPEPQAARPDDAEDLLAVQRALSGEPRAFETVVRRYSRSLYSLALRMLEDPHDAEEAVQEIFFLAFRKLGGFQIHRRFHPWLYTIALNHLRSALRKRRRGRNPRTVDRDVATVADSSRSSSSDPEGAVTMAEGERLAAAALKRLKREYREVFVLREVQGLSVREVSEILGMPEGTVKTNLHRARRQLIQMLADSHWE
jgi:RNA polymerase sigma-70 factor (ECF subfamily)